MQVHATSKEAEVLQALSKIIDPDFGMDIVQCGFVKDLIINQQSGHVKFRLELTTPACPVKDEFERKALTVVNAIDWVQHVDVKMDAVPPRPVQSETDRPHGLRSVAHVIAVSSCKGGMHNLKPNQLISLQHLTEHPTVVQLHMQIQKRCYQATRFVTVFHPCCRQCALRRLDCRILHMLYTAHGR